MNESGIVGEQLYALSDWALDGDQPSASSQADLSSGKSLAVIR
jgi:hypothetical protein